MTNFTQSPLTRTRENEQLPQSRSYQTLYRSASQRNITSRKDPDVGKSDFRIRPLTANSKSHSHYTLRTNISSLHDEEVEEYSVLSHVSNLLPIEIASHLTQLNLSFTNLKNIPEDLFYFENLIQLHLNDNLLTNIKPFSFVTNLPNLQIIDLSNNRIPNLYDVIILGHLKELRELNLLGNPIANIDNRPALIQELLFKEWKPLEEEIGFYESQTVKSPDSATDDSKISPLDGTKKLLTSPNFKTDSLRMSLQASASSTSLSTSSSPSKINTSKSEESPSKVQKSSSSSSTYINEELVRKRIGYFPSPKGTPRLKKVLEQRPKSAFMKRTSSFSNKEREVKATTFDELPSTLSMSKYTLKHLQKIKREKPVIYKDDLDDLDDLDEQVLSNMNEDAIRTWRSSRKASESQSESRPFKDSLQLLTESFKSTTEIIHRLKDLPVPRSSHSYFPYLITLNCRNITVEEYLMAENEEIFDICTTAPRKIRRERPDSSWAQNIDMDDTPLEEEPTYVTTTQDFSKSENLADSLNYIRVNHHRPDIADVCTYSDARFKVRDHKDMLKILDKSCKAEYVEIDDYKNIEGAKKWKKAFDQVSADLGSINFNDVLRWEHKQILKKANKLIGSKKKPRTLHVAKHRYENLTFDQVETSIRKSELSLNITTTKRNVKPVQPHNPHQITEFCRNERMHRRKLAKRKGQEFSQRHISLQVQKAHPEDDIVQFFSHATKQFSKEALKNDGYNSDDSDYDVTSKNSSADTLNSSRVDISGNNLSGRDSLKNRLIHKDKSSKKIQEKRKLLSESKEKVVLGGMEFEFSPLML